MSQASESLPREVYLPANQQTEVNVTMPSNAQTLTDQQLALLASAQRDYNLSPEATLVANTIQQNSNNEWEAIQTITNYVSNHIQYNNSEMETTQNGTQPNYLWKPMDEVFSSHLGICVDYADEAVGMLNSIGIEARTYSANTKTVGHEWFQVWDANLGSGQWVAYDPCWDSITHEEVSNEYDGDFEQPNFDNSPFANNHNQLFQDAGINYGGPN
jgi:transglutaminase-like putative cysteine protease